MPPLPGEERLVTLYADVHYYFQKPSNRPLRHRFDKASYFYIYYNSTRHSSRIEIANNPGSSEQDAVHGYIEKSKIINASRFPSLVTIEVDAEGLATSPTSPVTKDLDEWRLPSGDLRDTSREKLKVHTLDIYFWAQDDARLTVEFFRKLLAPAQLDIGDPPAGQHSDNTMVHDSVSSVVKNLENVAVSDPAYQNGQTRNSQAKQQAVPVQVPPPPPPPPQSTHPQGLTSSASLRSSSTGPTAAGAQDAHTSPSVSSSFAPLAYNPAAPAAPEPISHREKTPPPEDGVHGTGLQHAVHDHGQQSGFSATPQPGNMPGSQQYQHSQFGQSPPPSSSQSSHFGSPPPPAPSATPGQQSHASSAGYGSPAYHQQPQGSMRASVPSFARPPSNSLVPTDPHSHSIAAQHYVPVGADHYQQEAETPSEQFYESLSHNRKPLQHVQPRYKTEYFQSTGSAAYPQQTHSPPQNEYDIHSSVYRPTEAEAASHGHHKPSKSSQTKQDSASLKGFAKRFTTGINKTINKAETKYGA